MELFSGVISIKTITFLMFCVFAITAVGYLLGRITIKGVNLGTAGVFIIALLFWRSALWAPQGSACNDRER